MMMMIGKNAMTSSTYLSDGGATMAANEGIFLVLFFSLFNVFPLLVQKHTQLLQFLVLARDFPLLRLQFL